MIGQTRDIVNGKGERDFSYMMVCVFFKIFPELGHNAVKLLLESDYGCWSDFKYFCHFVLEHYPRCADLICTAIDIAIYNFDKDRYNWENAIMKYLKCVYGEPKKQFVRPDGRKHMSLIAKWMPREGSRFHWIYERVVSKWHVIHSPFLFENIRDTEHYEKIMRKCKTDFRQMLSAMNRELDTVQIKQCEKRMGDIYPEKVPLQCILKNINCFTDKDKDKCVDTNYDADGFKNIQSFDSNAPIGKGIHEMGTARMGRDPKTSVLNKYNQVHAVPNVFVTDGAFMASSGTQNPSLTYMAFTARAVNHAVSELKKMNL